MAAGSTQPVGAETFTAPKQVNHRRYEALRAYFVNGLSYEQAGELFGYTRWTVVNLVRDYRAGKLDLFTPPRKPGPPPGTAPAKEKVRGRVVELRRQGLSTYEISAPLAATPVYPGPPRSTSPPGRRGCTPAWPGCCWPSPTWSPWTCPPWPNRPATPAPAWFPPPVGCCPCSPSSSPPPDGCRMWTTCCSSTRPRPCWPGWTPP